jgi:hypothetical protein
MATITSISLTVSSSPSLILSDLSSYTTLPFLAAFDIAEQPTPVSGTPSRQAPKRVTYIALAKKTMPMLVELFMKYKDSVQIYSDGTLEAILSVRVGFSPFASISHFYFFQRHIQYLSNLNMIAQLRRSLEKTLQFGKRPPKVSYALSKNVPVEFNHLMKVILAYFRHYLL